MNNNVNINLSATPNFACPRCKSEQFVQSYTMKFIPALTAGNPHAAIIPVMGYACAKCGYLHNQSELDVFKPKDK